MMCALCVRACARACVLVDGGSGRACVRGGVVAMKLFSGGGSERGFRRFGARILISGMFSGLFSGGGSERGFEFFLGGLVGGRRGGGRCFFVFFICGTRAAVAGRVWGSLFFSP